MPQQWALSQDRAAYLRTRTTTCELVVDVGDGEYLHFCTGCAWRAPLPSGVPVLARPAVAVGRVCDHCKLPIVRGGSR